MQDDATQAKRRGSYRGQADVGFGQQVRSYVLSPYQMVKDSRTGVATSDVAAVLDGDIDGFLREQLAQRVDKRRAGAAAAD